MPVKESKEEKAAERKRRRLERQLASEAKELPRRERQALWKESKAYIFYLFMILAIVYITDEIASTIGIQFQSNILNEIYLEGLGLGSYGEAQSLSTALGFITYPISLLMVLYRPLADRFGRKPFLILNTFSMALGMFIIFLSRDVVSYMIGSTLMGFMVSHDMQCVYILECSNEKTRARNYAIVKSIAILGTLLIPLLRDTLMQNASERWHYVYLVPAIIGFVTAFLSFFFAKETHTFLEKRIAYLKTPLEEREKASKEEKERNAQGGIVKAVKFSFKHHQLRWLIIACSFFYVASVATGTYNTVMAESYHMSEADITLALYLYPVGNAVATFAAGFLSDRFGRRATILSMSVSALVAYLCFILCLVGYKANEGVRVWIPYVMGFAIGTFQGSYWGAGDTIGGIMFSESAPTNLRSSVTTINTLLNGIVGGLLSIVGMFVFPVIPVEVQGWYNLAITVPGLVGAIVVVYLCIGETRGLDLSKVTGLEWDKKKVIEQ